MGNNSLGMELSWFEGRKYEACERCMLVPGTSVSGDHVFEVNGPPSLRISNRSKIV